jgi:hypothetical protein
VFDTGEIGPLIGLRFVHQPHYDIAAMPIDMNALARLGAQTRIAQLIAEIDSLLEAFPGLGKAPARVAKAFESEEPAPRKRRKMSAATKAKIKAAWARRRAGTGTEIQQTAEPAKKAPEKKKRKMSAAGKARIAAAQKKRWAAIRRAKKNE